jgi:spermidine/putrescine transport system substrate-binding protein
MRRSTFRTLALVASLALVLAACGSGDGDEPDPSTGGGSTGQATGQATGPTDPADITGTLRLLSYSDGFDPGYLEGFHEQYPNITIQSSAMGSNEEAIAKLQAGFEADIVNSCVDEGTTEMVEKGLYAPMDVDRLVHWNDLFPSMRELPGVEVDGQVYMLPVDAGTAGVVYDADVVTTPPTSWTDLFDPQWQGRVGMEDVAVTAIMIGALATGITDPLAMTDEQLQSVKQYLMDHKSQFRTFWKGDAAVKSLFKSGEIVISSGYPDTANSLQKQGVNAKFVVASEGQFLWACGYGITPDVAPENLDAAYALLNYYASPEAELYEAETWNYQVANEKTLDIASPEVIERASLEAPFDLENAIPASPPPDRAAWVAAWTEVKAS